MTGSLVRRSSVLLAVSLVLASVAVAQSTFEVVDRSGRVIEVLDEEGAVVSTTLEPQDVVDLSEASSAPDDAWRSFETTSLGLAEPAAPTTIDRIDVQPRPTSHRAGYSIMLLGYADTYRMSDGSSWSTGVSYTQSYRALLDRVEVEGDVVRYFLRPADPNGVILEHEEYNDGEYSSVGTLKASGTLVIEASIGAKTAILRGNALVFANAPENYAEPRFKYFSARVGSVVRFEIEYSTSYYYGWQPDIFEKVFTYRIETGFIDFANPVSIPDLVRLVVEGSSRIPTEAELEYYAMAYFDSGAVYDVSFDAVWQVDPDELASLFGGFLSVGSSTGEVVVSASFEEEGITVVGEKTVLIAERGAVEVEAGHWPTYQGNRSHTGHVVGLVEPDDFGLRWETVVVETASALNPVAAGDGLVFVSLLFPGSEETQLFALDARDGEALWSQGFGPVHSTNPPAFAYGRVYIQTGKESSNGQPPLLHALDGQTGEPIFSSIFSAQWGRYQAPTVYDDHVYVNGGYFGGMYGFDAHTGQRDWFIDLPQNDGWTPAVDEANAYAYLVDLQPGLYVVNRITGALRFSISDFKARYSPTFSPAPVLGGRDDVIVIQRDRLVRFDFVNRRISWEIESDFKGQPSLHGGVIYAADGGELVAIEQETGGELWRWPPPNGEPLSGQIVLTDSHAFVRTESMTFAIDLLSRIEQWSYPRAGEMSIGNDTLYIAQSKGLLTAISLPKFVPSPAVSLKIEAPSQVLEYTETQLTATVTYEDGRVRDRTAPSDWILLPSRSIELSEIGVLQVGELLAPQVTLAIRAEYEENGVIVVDEVQIDGKISVPIDELIRRNLIEARNLREGVQPELDEATLREQAARQVLASLKQGNLEGPPSEAGAKRVLRVLRQSIFWSSLVEKALDESLEGLTGSLEELDAPDSDPPPEPPWWAWWAR